VDVRGRSGPCESYASVEYVTARSSEINNNNLQREDTTGKFRRSVSWRPRANRAKFHLP
jgi:hypothetical protein